MLSSGTWGGGWETGSSCRDPPPKHGLPLRSLGHLRRKALPLCFELAHLALQPLVLPNRVADVVAFRVEVWIRQQRAQRLHLRVRPLELLLDATHRRLRAR